MASSSDYDVVVVGSGPNGLCASIALAQAGLSVTVLEGKETIGGGTRTAELTLPGFLHDVCSAIHPTAAASPFLRSIDLTNRGLEWVYPPAAVAHPLDDGTAVLLEGAVGKTADSLGRDGASYRRLMEPLAADWEKIVSDLLRPLGRPTHPVAYARFGLRAFRSVSGLAETLFEGEQARALLAGLGAHSIQPLERRFTASFALVLGLLGHSVGWPVARGGSQRIAESLADHLRSLGGSVETGVSIGALNELPRARAVLFDLTPRQLAQVAGPRLTGSYRKRLEAHRYGPGAFKVDWALDGAIPWRASECARAGTVHLGGSLEEIAASESAVWKGEHSERPFVVLAQQSLFDGTRAPDGKHTAWAYCHVPNGSTFDMTEPIEAQVERFAPGFRDQVLARHTMGPSDLEEHNPNCVGGDIAGGAQEFWQLLARPALQMRSPYATPIEGMFMCSASTPPGGGVHGMCGYHAALTVVRQRFGRQPA